MPLALVAIDLETTGFDPARDRIVEIGAVRLNVDGADLVPRERAAWLVDPRRALDGAITRLTGLRDDDLAGAPAIEAVMPEVLAFLGDRPTLVGHNVAFDAAFLERAGLVGGLPRLDTAELAAILLPGAPSYALQRLAADEAIFPEAAHRALHDALTCAGVLSALARRARALSPAVLEECRSQAELLGPAYVEFFERALLNAWAGAPVPGDGARSGDVASGVRVRALAAGDPGISLGPPPGVAARHGDRRMGFARGSRDPLDLAAPGAPTRTTLDDAFAALEERWPAFEERPEQRQLAEAIAATFDAGGVLVAEAGTGTGKSLAYLVPALAHAELGERVIVSTRTLPLQDQLVRKDIPALQEALGTSVPVAVLKGRSNYLCPRRWQVFRTSVASAEEARLALKTLVWRTLTETGDRAELNLSAGDAALWPRISADDETCDQRRCARVAGGCYLQRARERAADAGIVVANHSLLLYDARMRSALLPESQHVVVDEAHHLEDVASDVFGYRLEERLLRRHLDRLARSPLVVAALADARAERAEEVGAAVDRARERVAEAFATLAVLLPPEGDDRLRITPAIRASDDRWLPVELAAERLSDQLAEVVAVAERLGATASEEEEDLKDELAAATVEVTGARIAIARGVHEVRANDIVWVATTSDGSTGLYVAPGHVGDALRRSLVERYRSVVLTSATMAVAGSLSFTLERYGLSGEAATLVLGSSFDHRERSVLIVPTDVAYPGEPSFALDVASTVEDVARAIGGRTLALFTSHTALRDVVALLAPLEDDGIAVLAQGLGGSRRSIIERFMRGSAVLLGTQSFWEGLDLPGDVLRCVVIAKLPFAVPDDPLVAGRSERYDDAFREFLLPQAALRLRQGYGRLLRTRSDRGAVVLMDRRVVERDYGATFIASLPEVRLRRVRREDVAGLVLEAARDPDQA